MNTDIFLRVACAFTAMFVAGAVCVGCGSPSSDFDSVLDSFALPPASVEGDDVEAEVESVEADADAPESDSPAVAEAESDAVEVVEESDVAATSDDDVVDNLPVLDVIPEGVIPKLGEDGEPILRTGLTISVGVTIADKVEVPTQVRLISPENTVMLPFVGVVSCEGMTIRQFRSHLTTLYGDYLHDPIVSAEFVTTGDAESPWGKVRVMGHVGREGWINIPATRDLSLLSALQRAGGVAKGAKRTSVRITRNMPDGSKKVFRADLDRLGKDGDEEQDIPLEPGDTVWVDERVW